MVTVDVRTFEAPDSEIAGEFGSGQQVTVGGQVVWRAVFEPGWRYTKHIEPTLCTASHLAYIAAGTLGIVMADGTEAEAGRGSVVAIPPGHDAWTVGDEPCVFIDFGESCAATMDQDVRAG